MPTGAAGRTAIDQTWQMQALRDLGISTGRIEKFRTGRCFVAFLFPNERGTPFRIGNYLKRHLKPIAVKAGIHDFTFQAMRRTCATQFQDHGSPKSAQAHLRHSKLAMTGLYIKEIPEHIKAAVENLDAAFCPEIAGAVN